MLHNAIKKLFTLISLLLINAVLSAQTKYSADQNYILSKKENQNLFSSDFQSAYPDTSITSIHNYSARNLSGNLGLAQPNYLLSYKQNALGFRFYDLPYGNDLLYRQQIEYYQTKGPIASVSGFAGSKQEQTFRMLFSHTTKKKLNISVKFNRFGSLGFYRKQQTFTNNFYSSLNYTNNNKRFGFYSYLLFNKVKHQENGGIVYDSLIDAEPTIGKDLLAVKLSNAKRENRLTDVSFNPWFRINKKDTTPFSHYLDYKVNYSGNYYWYLDNGAAYDGFYSAFYLDTTKTNDSTHIRQLSNSVHYTLKHSKSGLGLRTGYTNEYTVFHQHIDSLFTNQILSASLFWNNIFLKNDSLKENRNKVFHSEINYCNLITGSNSGDSKIEWNSEIRLAAGKSGGISKRTSSIFLKVASEKRTPDLLYNYIYANNFRWNNHFKKTSLFQMNAGFSHYRSGFSLGVLWQDFGNYLYFDSTAAPKQSNIVISNWAYQFAFRKVFFKHLGLNLNLCYQTTNKESLYRIAPIQAKGSLYYTGNLFKNNLQLQIGAQCEYYESFKSYSYMPAYNVYYLQNTHRAGQYPFVDVFINARIKPVQFFLKVENVLYGTAGTNYDFVKGYFQPDRAFRFGLTWLFFD